MDHERALNDVIRDLDAISIRKLADHARGELRVAASINTRRDGHAATTPLAAPASRRSAPIDIPDDERGSDSLTELAALARHRSDPQSIRALAVLRHIIAASENIAAAKALLDGAAPTVDPRACPIVPNETASRWITVTRTCAAHLGQATTAEVAAGAREMRVCRWVADIVRSQHRIPTDDEIFTRSIGGRTRH